MRLSGTLHHRVRLHGPLPAVEVFAALTAEGSRPGAVLLESADIVAPGGRRSLLIPFPLLRLTLRGAELRVEALDARGQRLLPGLAELLSGRHEAGVVIAPCPAADLDPAHDDHARLRSPSALDAVRLLAGLVEADDAPVPAGVFGAFAYELADRFETLPPRGPDPLDEPDLHLVFAVDGIAIDHASGEAHVVARSLDGEPAPTTRLEAMLAGLSPPARRAPVASAGRSPRPVGGDADAFEGGVRRVLGHVAAGDVFQLVLSRAMSVESQLPPLDAYRRLRALNPSPYLFYVETGDGALLGASPETAVKVTAGKLEIAPIAGTVRRGEDEDADGRLALSLLLDPKEQAEHVMLVDLARNDVARVSIPGSRRVEALFQVERYSHVQHLVSRVTGQLRPDLDALHAWRACAPMGTLTGAPKLRAMELIRELEPTARGFYGGTVGYLTAAGDFDSAIVIRSLRWKGGTYHARAGAGVVADSNPSRELDETTSKAGACLAVLA
jgi:anthranilate synthase component 1